MSDTASLTIEKTDKHSVIEKSIFNLTYEVDSLSELVARVTNDPRDEVKETEKGSYSLEALLNHAPEDIDKQGVRISELVVRLKQALFCN